MVSRLLAVVPAVLAAVSFALSVVLLAAGTSPSAAPEFFWLSFNTTNLGGNLIEITREDGTTNGAGSTGLPTPGGPLGDFFDSLRGTFDGLINDVANAVNSGIEDLQSSILSNLTDSLNVRDMYSLYLSKICEGDLTNPNDVSSEIRLDKCVPYDETREGLRNVTSSIPSSLTIGGTTISVPLVEALSSTLDTVLSLAIHGSRALFALRIISAVSMGITMLASLAVLILGHRRFLVRLNLLSGLLGGITNFLFAAVMTGLIVAGQAALSGLGGAVGLQIKQGGPFLILGWVAAGLGMGASLYWTMVWFVDFRLSSFKRRERTGDEIGNWRGIFREVKGDLRLPKKAQ